MNTISSIQTYSAQYTGAFYNSKAALIEAVHKKDLQQIKQLAMEAELYAEVDADGNTALMIAAKNDWVEAVEFLANNGSNVHAQNQQRETALSLAIAHSAWETALALFDLGAKITVSDLIKKLPYDIIEDPQYADLLGVLIISADDIDAQNADGETELFLAVESGNENLVKTLLENGADITLKNKRGKTACAMAIAYGKFNIIKFFQDHGEQVGIRELINHTISDNSLPDNSALLTFIDTSRSHELDEKGRSFLDAAVAQSLFNIAQFLIHLGVKRRERHIPNGEEKLKHALIKSRLTDKSLWDDLINSVDNINSVDSDGLSVLMHATKAKNLYVAQELINKGADVNQYDNNGMSALHHATKARAHDLMQELIESDADIELENKHGKTALYIAVYQQDLAAVEILIHAGAEVHKQKPKNNPIFRAFVKKNIEIVQLLRRNEAKSEHAYPKKINSYGFFKAWAWNCPHYEQNKSLFTESEKKIGKAILALKIRGHIFNFSGSVNCTAIDNKLFKIELEGLYPSFVGKLLRKEFELFCIKTPVKGLSISTQERVRTALVQYQSHRTSSNEELLSSYLQGQPILICTGFRGHCVVAVLTKKFFGLVNRGEASRKSLEIYPLDQNILQDGSAALSLISRFRDIEAKTNIEYEALIHSEFQKKPYLAQTPLTLLLEENLSLPEQTVGNCAFASIEGAIALLFGLEAIEEANIESSDPEELSRAKEILSQQRTVFEEFKIFLIRNHLEQSSKKIKSALFNLEKSDS